MSLKHSCPKPAFSFHFSNVVLMSSSSPFRWSLNNWFRSKISVKFLPTFYFLSATKRCAQPNLLIFNIPQIISLTTDVALSYTETHTRPKITASDQSWSELIALFLSYMLFPYSLFFPFLIALYAQCFELSLYHLQSWEKQFSCM